MCSLCSIWTWSLRQNPLGYNVTVDFIWYFLHYPFILYIQYNKYVQNLILWKRFVIDQEINLSDAWVDGYDSVAFIMWELCIKQELVLHNQPTDSSDEPAWCQLHTAFTPFSLLRCVSEDTDHFHTQTHQLDGRHSISLAKVYSPRGFEKCIIT